MFEWILFGLVAAVTVAACITIGRLREAMTKAKINLSEIIDIDRVKNKIKLQDLESRLQIEVTGDDISDDLYVGQKIRRKPVATGSKNEERESFFTPEEERMFEAMENDPELAAQAKALEDEIKDFEKNGSWSLLFIGDNY